MIRALDLLFAYAFTGGIVAVFSVGIRILLMSNDPTLVFWSTVLLFSAATSGAVASAWAFVDMERTPKSSGQRLGWKEVIWRYAVVLGPAAYYLGEYRPNVQPAKWFARLRSNRRALDIISFVAWRGTLAMYGLIVVAVVAAVAQSSPLFLIIGGLVVVLIPMAGAAFCLMSLVVLVHATEADFHNSSRMHQLKAVPRIGPLAVRGFYQYYERTIRPTLSASNAR